MSSAALPSPGDSQFKGMLQRLGRVLSIPALALITALMIGGVVIFLTSGSLTTTLEAYWGLIRGAFFKERGLSESLVATVPYILLSLGLAVGFKSGLFNIGVEGQFYMGALSAAWVGQVTTSLPTIIHLPLTLLAGALGGGLWAAIAGYLKVRTGAHEVISTMMMNYLAFRLTEFFIMGPLRDPFSSAVQTPRISPAAELWTLAAIPERLQDPASALGVAIFLAGLTSLLVRAALGLPRLRQRALSTVQRRAAYLGSGAILGLVSFIALPPLTQMWWPFKDQYDRLHIGLILAVLMAFGVWWLMQKTTLGFELRTAGANPHAAEYAGMNVPRNVVLALAISGALAGLAGTVEELGVSICRCLPLFFSSGYGFDSIAIALLAKNDPIGILGAAFLFGAMRNGADTMELYSGVSKYIISLIQALALLFVAAPAIVRWIYRLKGERRGDEPAPLTRGWGG